MSIGELKVVKNNNSSSETATTPTKKNKKTSNKNKGKLINENSDEFAGMTSEEIAKKKEADLEKLHKLSLESVDSEYNIIIKDLHAFSFQSHFGISSFINKILAKDYAIRKIDSKEDFYVWNGSLMVKDEKCTYMDVDKKMLSQIECTINKIIALNLYRDLEIEFSKLFYNFANSIRSVQNFSTLINRAVHGADGIVVPDKMWDKDVMELTTPEGIIDLTNGQVRDIKKEDYRTRATAVSLVPKEDLPAFENSLFCKVLNDVFMPIGYPTIDQDEKDPKKIEEYSQELSKWKSGVYLREAIEFFQTVMGYTLLGTNFLHKFVVCVGPTHNGKGLLTHMFRAVLGDEYVRTAGKQTFVRSPLGRTAGSATPDLEYIKNARIILVEETDRKDALDSALIKNMTGGDSVSTRGLHQEQKALRFQGVPFFVTNFMPSFDYMDKAMDVRCIIIPFLRIFDANVENNDDPFLGKEDPKMQEKLEAPEEKAIIFNWLVQGAIRASKLTKLEVPTIFKPYTNKYRQSNDILQTFLDERCIERKNGSIHRKTLYDIYASYLKDNGFKIVSSKTFYEGLTSKGYSMGCKDGYQVVKGLDLYYRSKESKESKDKNNAGAENTDTVMVEVEFDVAEAGGFTCK